MTSWRSQFLYLLAWLLPAAASVAALLIAGAATLPGGLLFALPLIAVFALGAGYSVHYLCRAHPLSATGAGRAVGAFAIAALVSGAAWAALAAVWGAVLRATHMPWASVTLGRPIIVAIIGLGMMLYALCAVLNYLIIEFERAQFAQRRELELCLLAQGAELRMLRAQIDPHFLFNCLNSISALITQDPPGARTMTLLLSDFLRQSLALAGRDKITLAEELTLSQRFLSIEKVRFGERLAVVQTVSNDAAQCMVPPLLFQPLIENAVKHGIAQQIDGGSVRVTAQRLGNIVQVTIENDVDPGALAASSAGIGLANVTKRLAAEYGSAARIALTQASGWFRVEVSLPAQAAGKED